jgi:hypothetical protein
MRWALVALSLSVWAAAQDSSGQQPATTPAPAFGQNAPILNPENPSISGLDEPALHLGSADRSFIAPALRLSQSADTNPGNQFGTNNLQGVTRLLGALNLQRVWSKSDFLAEYLGGLGFYSRDGNVRQMQAVGVEAIRRWRTGQAALRDAFNYLPEGNLSFGVGGDPGLGLTTGRLAAGEGLPGFQNYNASVGLVPRLANSAVVDLVQSVDPRSAFTVAGGFSNTHFYDNTLDLINSDQTTILAGYSHLLNRRDQIAGVYGFQLFRFQQGTGRQLQNQIFNLRWSRMITGRMSLIVGAGPQSTVVQVPSAPDIEHWSVNGRAQLVYRFARTSLIALYEKYTSSGSGFFAGADAQRARFGVGRELGQNLDLSLDLAYSHNKSLQPLSGAGAAGKHYDEGSAGAVLRKHLGRAYDVFAAYHFGEVGFDNAAPFCGLAGAGACGNISQRHSGTVGVEWHPRPKRIE